MKSTTKRIIKFSTVVLILTTPFIYSNVNRKIAKPTFKERVLAESESGKKVAVFTNLSKIAYNHSASSEDALCKIGEGIISSPQGAMTSYTYKVQLEEDTPLEYDVSNMVADQLNQGINTSVFAAVGQDEVSSKTVTFLGMETEIKDWWQTDYTIIVEIVLAAYYETSSASPYKTSLKVAPIMYVREVVEGKEALGFIVNGRSLGNSTTQAVTHEECFSSLDQLISGVSSPDALLSQVKDGINEPLAKFIEQENSKYEKAMKKKKK